MHKPKHWLSERQYEGYKMSQRAMLQGDPEHHASGCRIPLLGRLTDVYNRDFRVPCTTTV